MKKSFIHFLFASLLFVLASFTFTKENSISVYINGKTIATNTVVTYQAIGTGAKISANIPSGARFNELTLIIPNVAVGNYPITAENKAQITYNTTLGQSFNSQNQNSTKGFIKITASTNNSLNVEFECAMTNAGQKLALKTGKVQVTF